MPLGSMCQITVGTELFLVVKPTSYLLDPQGLPDMHLVFRSQNLLSTELEYTWSLDRKRPPGSKDLCVSNKQTSPAEDVLRCLGQHSQEKSEMVDPCASAVSAVWKQVTQESFVAITNPQPKDSANINSNSFSTVNSIQSRINTKELSSTICMLVKSPTYRSSTSPFTTRLSINLWNRSMQSNMLQRN